MKIPVERHSATPVYRQIRDRLSRLIHAGKLQPGERLPSIRALSTSLQVNKLTVNEAYSLLEADGLIHARQGSGYFVNCAALPIESGISILGRSLKQALTHGTRSTMPVTSEAITAISLAAVS